MSAVFIDCHLVIGQKTEDRNGGTRTVGRPTVSAVKTKPKTAPHEIAIALNLELPLSLFIKPALSARIVVPADQAPISITPEIQENIARAVQEQTGIVLRIEAPATNETKEA